MNRNETNIMLTLYRLANENDMTIDAFVKHIQGQYTIDTSDYPRNEEHEVIYPDGKIGLVMENWPVEDELRAHQAAALKGITFNDFVNEAISAKMTEMNIEADTDTGC